jgi:hypothetical protein
MSGGVKMKMSNAAKMESDYYLQEGAGRPPASPRDCGPSHEDADDEEPAGGRGDGERGGGVGGARRRGHREGAKRHIQGAGPMDGHEGAALGNRHRRDEDRAKADGSPREAQMQVEAGMALLVCAELPRA